MPIGFVHTFWIESLKQAASEIPDACFVVVSLVAMAKGLPPVDRHLRRLAIPFWSRIVILCPSDGFGDQVQQRRHVARRDSSSGRATWLAYPRRRACSRSTMSRPNGVSETGISLKFARPSGMPMMVRHISTPVTT